MIGAEIPEALLVGVTLLATSSLIGLGVWLVRKVTAHDATLARIDEQLRTNGGGTLRDKVDNINRRFGLLLERLGESPDRI